MMNLAGLFIRTLVTSYVDDSAKDARDYIHAVDEDKRMCPEVTYDTLYKCYEKLSDTEIKVFTAAVLQGFFNRLVSDYDTSAALDGIIRDTEQAEKNEK